MDAFDQDIQSEDEAKKIDDQIEDISDTIDSDSVSEIEKSLLEISISRKRRS